MQRRNAAGANPQKSASPPLYQPIAQNPSAARKLLAHSPPPDVLQQHSHRVVPPQADEYQRFSSPPIISNAGSVPQNSRQGFGSQSAPQSQPFQNGPAYHHQPQQSGSNINTHKGQQNAYTSPWGNFGMGSNAPAQQQQQQPAWANDATTQMGVQFGMHAVQAGSEYVERNFTRHLPITYLQHSFNVSNIYVLKKIRIVLFPWRHKPWSRSVARSEQSGQAQGYRPPREDINSPDLYIPVMALVTYILLSGIVAGAQSRFGPELLGRAASRSLGIVFFEFMIIKLGTYLLNIGGEGTVVDLFAYSGYKFVGIIVTLLADLLKLQGWAYWSTFFYVFFANFFFLLRSLKHVVLPDPALIASLNPNSTANPVTHTTKQRRILFLFCIAGAQSLSMLFLARV